MEKKLYIHLKLTKHSNWNSNIINTEVPKFELRRRAKTSIREDYENIESHYKIIKVFEE